MKKVLIAAPISARLRDFLMGKGFTLLDYESIFTANAAYKTIEGILTSNKLNLDSGELQKFPDLKWIARLGSGMEIIDTKYCDLHGIHYMSSPAGIANAVAEHVIGMLLSLLHHIDRASQQIRQQQWNRESNRGSELEELCVGIIGFGHTGKKLAEKLKAFTPSIVVYDKYKTGFSEGNIREVSLIELQEKADIISFHIPLNEETFHYYNQAFCAAMKKDHILINASRGAVADTDIILSALRSGKLKGACLDVLQEEDQMPGLLRHNDNIISQLLDFQVVMTPHIAGYSHGAIQKMCDELIGKLSLIV